MTRDEQIREEILGALACIDAALINDALGGIQGRPVIQLAAAAAALRRANDLLRPEGPNLSALCPVCNGDGCPLCPTDGSNVVQFPMFSVHAGRPS